MKIKAVLLMCLTGMFAATHALAAAEKSCKDELGSKQAQVLVGQCLEVSPATRPPCNAANSCELIKSEITRGCDMLAKDPKAPKFCNKPAANGKAG